MPAKRKPAPFSKGDLIKPDEPGSHTMTVVGIAKDGKTVTASYTGADGTEHKQDLPVERVRRVTF